MCVLSSFTNGILSMKGILMPFAIADIEFTAVLIISSREPMSVFSYNFVTPVTFTSTKSDTVIFSVFILM